MNLDYHRHLEAVVAEDVRFTKERDTHYGGSWAKRGGPGAFINLARKWDRLETFMEKAGYDLFWEIAKQAGPEQGSDGTVLAEIRDLRRYLLLVEAKMVQAGAVELPVTAQETMKQDILGGVRENVWNAVGPHGLIEQGKEALYYPGGGRSIRVAVLQLYADGSAEIVHTEGPGRGLNPQLATLDQLRPLENPNPPPAASPVPVTSAGAPEEASATKEPGEEDDPELVSDRQPVSATEHEYRAIANMLVRRGTMKHAQWCQLYAMQPDASGRWFMLLKHYEEYGR